MAKLTKTKMPGIFRRHAKGCNGRGRCECSYVLRLGTPRQAAHRDVPHRAGGPRGTGGA